MRKLFTFLLTMVVTMVANAAITPTVQLGDEFTSAADLAGKSFAIVDKAAEKALFGSNNQNLAFDAYGSAFVTTNSGYTWQLESLAENEDESVHGYYLLHLVAPNGTPVPTSDWGGKYLNSQDKGGWCCFNLGITAKKLGQDIDYGAVWDVQFVEGKGFSLKNIGTGLYKGADGGTANKEEAVYFAFVPVSITYVPALKALLAEGEAMKKRGASSAAYDAAIEGIDPDKSEDALADAQKVEAALPALAMTQLTAGSDFTRAIANFDCGAKDGWTFEKPLGGNGPDHGGDFEYWAGNASNRAEASFDYWQEITGLPNGTYTVSAEMYNSLNNEGGDYTEFKPTVGVYATVGEKTVSKLVDVNSETRVPYVTDVIEVTDGKIRIGAKSFEAPMAARWFTVDNFKLTLVKPAVAPTAPEKDAWFTGADGFRFRALKNAGAESPYAAYSDKVEPGWAADPDDINNGCIVAVAAPGTSTTSQLWIKGGDGFSKGNGFTVTMRVKADAEYKEVTTTAHKNWGWFTNAGFGNLDITTEWKTVSIKCIATDGTKDFTDLCINLSGDAERTYYFDDIQIVSGSEWYLNNEFHAKDYKNGDESYSDDMNNPHPVARFVADAEGGYVEVISNANAGEVYNSQLWIAIPEKYVGGNTKMTMEVQASKAITLPENYQATATGCGWGCSPQPGTGVVLPAGEWTTVERVLKTKDVKSNTWNSAWNGWQADQYCLDLSEKGGEAITYKFRNLKFEDAEEPWTETMAYRLKVTPFTYNEETGAYDKGADTNEAPTYDFGTGGEEGGYFKVTAAGKQAATHETQFFFQIADVAPSKELKNNEKVTLKFKIKALATETLAEGTEVTAGGGYHKSYDGAGWLPASSSAPATKFTVGQWTAIEQVIEVVDAATKCYSIDLSQDANPITYLIDDVEATWAEAPVLDWVELISNGDCEAAPEHVFAVSKETPVDGAELHQARVVAGVGKDGSKGIEFVAGAKTADPWDNQFWIYEPYALPSGTNIIVEFDYKADVAASSGSQSHNAPGAYLHWAAVGTPQYTTEWQHFKFEGKIPSECDGKDDDGNTVARFLSIAFNMSDFADPNKYYFDNFSFRVPAGTIDGIEPVYVDDLPVKEYIDPATLDFTDNLFTNGDIEGEDMSAFIAKVNDDADALLLPAGTKSFKGSNQILVKSAAREADPENEGKYLGNDHDTQFFVRLPYALPAGTTYFFSVDYLSNKVANIPSQTHGEPGQWKGNKGVGSIATGSDAQTLSGYFKAEADMRSIAFNLAAATEGGQFYFDNFVFKVVKDEEAAIKEFTATWDGTSTWNETFALNQAVDAGRTTETEGQGYTAESVQALTDAIAAGKAELANAEATKETLAAAAKAIEDAIAGLTAGAPELAYTDLTPEMFFQWTDWTDAEPTASAYCEYKINEASGQPYGDPSVNNYADLSEYATLEVTATEGSPRFLFNRDVAEGQWSETEADSHLIDNTKGGWSAKYFTSKDNGDGTTTYIVDIAAIVADKGFAHLMAIKGANWANVTVTDMKLGYEGEQPAIPVPTNINGVEDGASVKDGKYFINGQIVIVKDGVKYNAAGVAIQ